MRPLRNNIIVKRLEADTTTEGGIILSVEALEVPTEGRVIACGNGVVENGERTPLEVKVGDVILFPAYGGTDIIFNGETHVIMEDTAVLAVIQEAKGGG
tara:strand:- start:92 stop:388 length:297 start_codon:yes stop_codon:yes gene_type:complete